MSAPLEIIVPGLENSQWNEVEALGAAVWLWTHSRSHRNFPLHTLPTLLLPAIKCRQFALAYEDGKPVFYLSWAFFSEQAETRYLTQSPLAMPESDWNCGERLWLLDWVAPFGHTLAMHRWVRTQLFVDRCIRYLHHRGNERGLRVKHQRGLGMLLEEATVWERAHPIRQPATATRHPGAIPE